MSGARVQHTLDERALDAIASALTPELLTPYLPPARPFVVGQRSVSGIREDYREQVPNGELAPPVMSSTMRIARTVAHALGDVSVFDSASTLSPLTNFPNTSTSVDVAQLRNAVVICADQLPRVAPLELLLEALVLMLQEATIAIVTAPLRLLSSAPDDLGPPSNPAYAREWTFPELHAGLDAYGLSPLFGGLIADAPSPTAVIVVSTRAISARNSTET